MSILIASLVAFGSLQAGTGDYFPLKGGAVWEYQLDQGFLQIVQTQKAVGETQIAGKTVKPVEVWLNGKFDSVTYYVVEDGFYAVAAHDGTTLLPAPIRFLPVEPKAGQKWEFRGKTMTLGTMVETYTKYRVSGMEKVDALGVKYEAVKVVSNTTLGSGRSAMKIERKDLYVRGLGLVSSKQEVLSKGGGSATITLRRFEGGE